MLKNLEKEEEFDTFLTNNQERLILVKFSTEWCPPCKVLQKNLEKLLAERAENKEPDLVVLAVDADRFPQLRYRDQIQKVQQLVIHSVPTIFLFHRGQMVKKGSGSATVQELKEFIRV